MNQGGRDLWEDFNMPFGDIVHLLVLMLTRSGVYGARRLQRGLPSAGERGDGPGRPPEDTAPDGRSTWPTWAEVCAQRRTSSAEACASPLPVAGRGSIAAVVTFRTPALAGAAAGRAFQR